MVNLEAMLINLLIQPKRHHHHYYLSYLSSYYSAFVCVFFPPALAVDSSDVVQSALGVVAELFHGVDVTHHLNSDHRRIG